MNKIIALFEERVRRALVGLSLFCAVLWLVVPCSAQAAAFSASSEEVGLDEALLIVLIFAVVVGAAFHGVAALLKVIKVPVLPGVVRVVGNVVIGLIVVVGAIAGMSA